MTTSNCLIGGDASSRRAFLKTALASTAALAAAPAATLAGPTAQDRPETLVAQLHKSFDEKQRQELCFPFEHPLRQKVDNNWHITKTSLDANLTPDQRELVKQIFLGLHSEEWGPKVLAQVTHDSGKAGFGSSSIALFGEPGTGKFEFVLTGRHCTRRCDGDSVAGAAFGGPIFYGHAAKSFYEKADHQENVYWHQAKRANEVYQMLDGKQRKLALLDQGRPEKGNDTIKLTGKKTGLPGVPLTELASDQKNMVRKVMADLLAPFRKVDAAEVMKLVEKNGFDNLHMAFFKQGDIGEDGVWDVWQLEGPAMVWYFRGEPHVHTWVHVRESV